MLDNALIAASLANLMLMWEWLNAFHPEFLVFNIHAVSPNGMLAFALVFLFYFAVFFSLLTVSARVPVRLSRAISVLLFLFFLFPWFHVRNFYHSATYYPWLFSPTQILGNWGKYNGIKFGAFGGIFLWLSYKYADFVSKLTRSLLLTLFPFFILTFGTLVWKHFQSPTFEKETTSVEKPTILANKTLWIIFDAFDYNYSFNFREKETRLTFPEIDRFKNASFSFREAIPPTPMTTFSMSSYILGKTVVSFNLLPYQAATQTFFEDGSTIALKDQPHLFKSIHALGARIAIIGWHIPYCPLFSDYLDYCTWFSPTQWPYQTDLVTDISAAMSHTYFAKTALSNIRRQIYEISLDRSVRLLEKNKANLTLLHFPVPHFPGLRKSLPGETVNVSEDKTIEDYYSNLKLADEALGKIRATLEKNNQWDDMTVIITSDHWLRYAPDSYMQKYGEKNFEIPLLVKLPKTNTGEEYTKAIPTLQIGELITGTLNGKITTPSDLRSWADRLAKAKKEELIEKTARVRDKVYNHDID